AQLCSSNGGRTVRVAVSGAYKIVTEVQAEQSELSDVIGHSFSDDLELHSVRCVLAKVRSHQRGSEWLSVRIDNSSYDDWRRDHRQYDIFQALARATPGTDSPRSKSAPTAVQPTTPA